MKTIILTGHSKLDSGGVGTHLRILIDELKKKDILSKVILGVGKKGKSYHLINKVYSRLIGDKGLYYTAYPLVTIYFLKNKLEHILNLDSSLSNGEKVIIHCHDRSSVIAANMLREKYNIKIVQTIHAPFYQQYLIHPEYKKSLTAKYILGLDRETVNLADVFIAVDNLQRELLLRDFEKEIVNKKIFVVPNAIEKELLIKKEYFGKRKSNNYFVVARHLHEKNGIEFAIKAFSLFSEKNPEYKLYILGQGPLEQNLRNLVTKLGLSSKIIFKGALPRIKCLNLISGSKASIVPSVPVGDYIEATSLTMLETMAMGVPLIASNIGGIKQVLDGQDAAFLIPPYDIKAMYYAMNDICNNDHRVLMYRKNSLKLIKENYLASIWIKKILDIYSYVYN